MDDQRKCIMGECSYLNLASKSHSFCFASPTSFFLTPRVSRSLTATDPTIMTSPITSQNVFKATVGVAAGAYCVYSFLSLYAIVYLGGAAYTLHLFIRNPDLFLENKEVMIESEPRVSLPRLDMEIVERHQPSPVQRPSAVTHFKNKQSMNDFTASPVMASPIMAPSPIRSTPISRSSYIPSKKPRQHRVPVVAPRRESTMPSTVTSSPFTKLMESPKECGYESDSSHASSSSSGRSASSATLGLPTYEKHVREFLFAD